MSHGLYRLYSLLLTMLRPGSGQRQLPEMCYLTAAPPLKPGHYALLLDAQLPSDWGFRLTPTLNAALSRQRGARRSGFVEADAGARLMHLQRTRQTVASAG